MKTDICWICRSPKLNKYFYFDFNDYLDMYKFCMNSKFSNKNCKLLCSECTINIQRFNAFKKQCLESEQYWQDQKEIVLPKHNYSLVKQEDEPIIYDVKEEIKKEIADENIIISSPEPDINDETEKPDNEVLEEMPTKYKFTGICDICNAVFERKHLLQKHLKSCGQSEPVKKNKHRSGASKSKKEDALYCGICVTTASDMQQMNEHLKQHYDDSDLQCRLCEFKGTDFAHMVCHRYEHQPKEATSYKSLSCFLCGDIGHVAWVPLRLEFHIRSTHFNAPGGRCIHCARDYPKYKRYRQHHRLLRTGGHVCPECGRSFVMKSELENHKLVHGEKKYMCNVCGDRFTRKYSLKSHMFVHSPAPVRCSHCNKIYNSEILLRAHLRVATAPRRFTCPICSKTFSDQSYFKEHMRRHTDDRPHKCELCSKTYKAKSHLVEHVKKHSFLNQHKCGVCEKTFSTAFLVRRHQSVHAPPGPRRPGKVPKGDACFLMKYQLEEHIVFHGEKKYMCNVCGDRFFRIYNLKLHMNRHSTAAPVPCSHCDKLFKNETLLKAHLRRETLPQPFSCHVCSKTFRYEYDHREHVRRHTGDRPYNCELCSKTFKSKSYQTEHMRLHSFLRHKCGECDKTFTTAFGVKRHQSMHAATAARKPGRPARVSKSDATTKPISKEK